MIIATWRVVDNALGGMKSVSEDFISEIHWEEAMWNFCAIHGGLPLWVVELSESGNFVKEWTLELDKLFGDEEE